MTLQKLLNHPLVMEMICAGIEPKIKAGGLELEGFYKSGTVLLYMDDDEQLVAASRYNERHLIYDLKSLVELNVEWWERSAARNADWLAPVEPWKSLMLKFGLIEEKIQTLVTYTRR